MKKKPFADIQGHWAENNIVKLVDLRRNQR